MKDAGKGEIVSIAMELRNLCNDCSAIFITDDRAELVREIGADGVHLGKNDISVAKARRILEDEYIIGSAANAYEDMKKYWLNEVDCIGCGPLRYTTTKRKLNPMLGLEGYEEIIRKIQEEKICHLPVVAIGGIAFADIPAIMQTGVTDIALSGTVLRADNPVEGMREMLAVVNQTDNY